MLCLLRISVDLNFGVTSIGTQCMSIVDELENYTVVVAQPTPSLPSSGIRIVLLESKEVYETSHNRTRTHMWRGMGRALIHLAVMFSHVRRGVDRPTYLRLNARVALCSATVQFRSLQTAHFVFQQLYFF